MIISGLMDSLIIAKRDILRTLRQRSQLYGSIVRPVIWLFLLGTGLRGAGFQNLPLGLNVQQFIFPGMIAMNILFAGVQSGTSIIWDREFGFLKEILVAPVSRTSIAFGKTLSGSLVASFQGLVVMALFPLLGLKITIIQLLLTLAAMFIVALSVTAIGILIAVRMTSFEGFGTINNFLVMPLFFLSGAMFPLDRAPQWLRLITSFNPLTYGVNLLRGTVLGLPATYWLDIAVITGFSALILSIAVYLFHQEGK
jgi:ABC-2 type transport system permease protein